MVNLSFLTRILAILDQIIILIPPTKPELIGPPGFRPYTTPAQSHHPLRGFVEDWRPREFRFIQELCPMEPVGLPKFTSGRRDLNPGPP